MNQAEELYAAETSENGLARGYLRLSLVASWILALLAVSGCVLMALASGKRHAYVVRIEPSGQYEASVEGFQYKRQPAEVGWFLKLFCREFFSRDRATINMLPQTLLYFSPGLREDIAKAWKEANTVENVVNSPTQVDAVATEVHLTREGTEAYITVRLDRATNGQKSEPQSYSTYVRFSCLACDGKPVPDDIARANPLGFQISNVPALSEGTQ